MAVVAHAQHGRLGLVAEITDVLPASLATLTADPGLSAGSPAASYPGLSIWGSLLLALAMTDLDRAQRSGNERAAREGARMIALAERFGFQHGFRPTMSTARARRAAQDADGPAYADAVSAYAGLDPDGLRAAVHAALAARTAVLAQGGDPLEPPPRSAVEVPPEQGPRPQVPGQREAGAPGERDERGAAVRHARQKPA